MCHPHILIYIQYYKKPSLIFSFEYLMPGQMWDRARVLLLFTKYFSFPPTIEK